MTATPELCARAGLPSGSPHGLCLYVIGAGQIVEAAGRAKRVHDRLWPVVPGPNPFQGNGGFNSELAAWFASPERGAYAVARNNAYANIKARLLAKIAARDGIAG